LGTVSFFVQPERFSRAAARLISGPNDLIHATVTLIALPRTLTSLPRQLFDGHN